MDINGNFDLRKFRDLLLKENYEYSSQEIEDGEDFSIEGVTPESFDLQDTISTIVDKNGKEIINPNSSGWGGLWKSYKENDAEMFKHDAEEIVWILGRNEKYKIPFQKFYRPILNKLEGNTSLEETLENDDIIYDRLVDMDHEQLVSTLLRTAEDDPTITLENFLNKYGFSEDEELNENQLEEMAKLTGKDNEITPLGKKVADFIKNNPELKASKLLNALKADPEISKMLRDTEEDIYQNQLNQFVGKIDGSREIGPRGRKANPNKPVAEPKVKAEKPAKEKSPKLRITDPTAGEKPVSSVFGDGSIDPEEMEMAKQAAKAAKGSKEFADEVAPDKTEKFNLGLKFVTKYKDDRDLVDAYLKKAKDEYKLSANMIKDLKRAAGRQVEA